MAAFDPTAYTTFEYTSYDIADDFTTFTLHYTLKGKGVSDMPFTEVIAFAHVPLAPGDQAKEAVQRICKLLFLAAGLSYYKTAAPKTIEVAVPLSTAERDFLETLLRDGMTEYAYVNNLPQALHPDINSGQADNYQPVSLANLDDQPVVPVGGGKDSIVTIEALRAAGFKPHLFAIRTYEYGSITQTAAKAGLPFGYGTRTLSPNLKELNANGAYSGHIPITAIVSLTSLLFAVLNGHKTVVISSERSASVGNTIWEGIEVNHQWSKSLALESLLRSTLAEVISPELVYFSLLRPLSELEITKYFATLTQYHGVFSSCNRAFLAPESQEGPYWCGHCPKCRFVFLMLGAFLEKEKLVQIFGANLFADESEAQLQGFSELLGIKGHKPLECVGEIEESRWAFNRIAHDPAWQEERMVKTLLADLPPEAMPTPEQEAELFNRDGPHFIPAAYMEALYAIK